MLSYKKVCGAKRASWNLTIPFETGKKEGMVYTWNTAFYRYYPHYLL